jgi:hypothetical protein
MSLEHISNPSVEYPRHESGSEDREEEDETITFLEMVLTKPLRDEFSAKFSKVKESDKSLRGEALKQFKIEYIQKKLRLAEILQEANNYFLSNKEVSWNSFKQEVVLDELSDEEKSEVETLVREKEERSNELKKIIGFNENNLDRDLNEEDALALFRIITGHDAENEKNISCVCYGDVLLFRVVGEDYNALCVVAKNSNDVSSLSDHANKTEGTFCGDCKLEREGLEDEEKIVKATYQLIIINQDANQDYFDSRIIEHEQQHEQHSNLLKDSIHKEDAKTKEEAIDLFKSLKAEYLLHVRDEIVAYVKQEEEIDENDFVVGGIYFYPNIEDAQGLFSEEDLTRWQLDEYWQNEFLPAYEQLVEEIVKVGHALVVAGVKNKILITLFEIEPPETWHRLQKWLQDPEIQQAVGLKM